MILILISLISLISLALVRLSPFHFLHSVTLFLHQKCLETLPSQSVNLPELKALVCAENFSVLASSEIFITTGLIHLFVVSGAHLQFLYRFSTALSDFLTSDWLETINMPNARNLLKRTLLCMTLLGLTIYTACCEFNPPITRSLFSLFLTLFLKHQKISWGKPYQVFICGLFTLIFNPLWLASMSLQMSWLLALLLLTPPSLLPQPRQLFQHVLCFIFLYPMTLFLQITGPLTILINFIFSPFLEYILFPMGLLTAAFNSCVFAFEIFIQLLNRILKLLEMPLNFQFTQPPSYFVIMNWSLILFLHLALHLYEVIKKRQEGSCA